MDHGWIRSKGIVHTTGPLYSFSNSEPIVYWKPNIFFTYIKYLLGMVLNFLSCGYMIISCIFGDNVPNKPKTF